MPRARPVAPSGWRSRRFLTGWSCCAAKGLPCKQVSTICLRTPKKHKILIPILLLYKGIYCFQFFGVLKQLVGFGRLQILIRLLKGLAGSDRSRQNLHGADGVQKPPIHNLQLPSHTRQNWSQVPISDMAWGLGFRP